MFRALSTLMNRNCVPFAMLVGFATVLCAVGNNNSAEASLSRSRNEPRLTLGGKDVLPIVGNPKEKRGTFATYEEREKRFELQYEAGLEKKEPAYKTIAEAREAIGRVEAKMGPFERKFALVVLHELNGEADPMAVLGTFGKEPAVLVTFNGTVTPVLAHGMAMRRIEELKPKASSFIKGGYSRLLMTADGFDPILFSVLVEHEGPSSLEDVYAKDADVKGDARLHVLATSWMLAYYHTELAKPKKSIAETLDLKAKEHPAVLDAWKAVEKRGQELTKKRRGD